jgi:hypothetical protein
MSSADSSENSAPAPQCSDARDNDGDGHVDFPDDTGCVASTDDSENSAPSQECSDGRDNDNDTKIDFPADPGCVSALDNDEIDAPPPPPPYCSDAKDNDGDAKIDFPADPGCVSALDNDETDAPPPPPPPAPQCSDGRDNDGDAKIDFPADGGCASAEDNDEIDPAPPPVVTAKKATLLSPFPVVRLVGQVLKGGARISLLTVQAPRNAQITIKCAGPGTSCPKLTTKRVSTGSRATFRSFQRRMRSGTILRIFVTRRGFIGKFTRFTIRRGKAPLRVDKCAGASLTVAICP